MNPRDFHRPFSERVNRILNVILLCLGGILLKVWHLSVIQHEDRVLQAQKPKRKSIWVAAHRGEILDRHGNPLAVNQETYSCGILFRDLKEIPRTWLLTDSEGKKSRLRARNLYVSRLAQFLGENLGQDPQRLEDMIWSKGALFPHAPCILCDHLSPEQFFRLKMVEKDWPGLVVDVGTYRYYPTGPSFAHIVGYLGKIGAEEYRSWNQEGRILDQALAGVEKAQQHLLEEGIPEKDWASLYLSHKRDGYTPLDWVGKTGIEKKFEKTLRGKFGLEVFESDTSGRKLKELEPEIPVEPGQNLRLALSLPLQQLAERCLATAEARIQERTFHHQVGSAAVVLDAKSGEILCMASRPSFDPNTMILRSDEVYACLENDVWLERVWDGIYGLDHRSLDWETFLQKSLGKDHSVTHCVSQLSIAQGLKALQIYRQAEPQDSFVFASILPGCPITGSERLLCIDLLRLVLEKTPMEILDDPVAHRPLKDLRRAEQEWARIQYHLQKIHHEEFTKNQFPLWREAHQKKWLALQRKEEKRRGRPHRPYLDLLDEERERQCRAAWETLSYPWYRTLFLSPPSVEATSLLQRLDLDLQKSAQWLRAFLEQASPVRRESFLFSLQSFRDLKAPLIGKYPFLRGSRKAPQLHQLASTFHPPYGIGMMRSFAFQHVAPIGSVFKPITAYEALSQSEQQWGSPRPDSWTIVEHAVSNGKRITHIGHTKEGTPIPKIYLGGRLPLTTYRHFGSMDLLSALERSSNPFFSMLTVHAMRHPNDLLEAAKLFGLGQRVGIDLPGEGPGRLPSDLETNRSGLYAFAIGQHEMRGTPLQVATLFYALAHRGDLIIPSLVALQPGEKASLKRKIPFSQEIHQWIHRGMYRAVHGATGTVRPSKIQQDGYPADVMRCYERIAPCLIAKTGTAQQLETLSPDPEKAIQMTNHVWFAGILYPDAHSAQVGQNPELILVIFLRFAHGGREGAVVAAQLAEGWRDLRDHGVLTEQVASIHMKNRP